MWDKDENEKLITTIKNMLLMTQAEEKTEEHKTAIEAITKWNTYEASVVWENIEFKVKSVDGKTDIWTITLGVKNKKITTSFEKAKLRDRKK